MRELKREQEEVIEVPDTGNLALTRFVNDRNHDHLK